MAGAREPQGTLILAGTPLGNPADASGRLADVLRDADLVAAEDTRRLRRLLRELGVARLGPVISFYEDVELARIPRLLGVLDEGGVVALVTDAGMPSVSDPGFRATRAALAAGHRVSAIPGPSAVITALAISGLPCDRFCFEGFLPRQPGPRRARLAELAAERRTQVYFESPLRIAATLADMAAAFGGQRSAAICRELTKTFEEVVRGDLAELGRAAAAGMRGEITLVVAGAGAAATTPASPGELAALVATREARGEPRKEAIVAVARERAVPRSVVYDAVVVARGRPEARQP